MSLRTSFAVICSTGMLCAGAAQASQQDFDSIKEMLSGSWKTTAPVGAPGQEGDVVMHIQEVLLSGVPNAMYVEMARADDPANPYRQVLFQLYDHSGDTRLRTLEFRNAPGVQPSIVGLWTVPEVFPDLAPESFYATLDLVVTPDGEGFVGETPYAYPTSLGGAVNMTSRLVINDGQLVTDDRGFAADGSVAWGEDSGYTWAPYESNVTAELYEDGLIAIDMVAGEGEPAGDGDTVTVHYTGWMRQNEDDIANGMVFDSSHLRTGEPFTFPLPGRLIAGWNIGVPGVKVGTVRRLFIPSTLAYGSRPPPGSMIGPEQDLVFELVVLDVIKPEPAAEEPQAEGAAPDIGAEQSVEHDHDGDGVPDHE